jgi:hypothetical protein
MSARHLPWRDGRDCRPRRLAGLMGLGAAGLLGVAQLSCAFANPPAAPARPPAAAMSNAAFTSNELLIQEVSRRLVAMLPPDGQFAVWVQLGPGTVPAHAKAALVAALQAEKRIVWSTYQRQQGGPVADSANPGQHVNVVVNGLHPAPRLVLLVNEKDGRLTASARPPGADPLGPPTAGWTWVLSGP